MDIYGEKSPSASKFVTDCRLLQSMYRFEIGEQIRPYKGRDGVIHYYGNYVEGGEVSGANFLTDYAFEYARRRVENKKKYETIEADRLFNNLLSSQPMAFNLFCPLRKMLEEAPELATRAVRAALPMYPIHEVIDVDLEFIPGNYMNLTGDKSAMDAIVRYRDVDGNEGFIAVETKYSENLGTNVASEKGRTRAKAKEIIKDLRCFKINHIR